MAATISQPDKPKNYVNIRSEELQICPREEYNGCARINTWGTVDENLRYSDLAGDLLRQSRGLKEMKRDKPKARKG